MDESCDAHDNLLCLNCSNEKETTETCDTASIQNEKDQGTTEATTNLSKLTPGSGKGNMDKKKAAQRKKKKKKQPPKLPARAEKIAKTPNQKSFVLQSDQSTPDPLVMKTVCFDVNDKKYGTELANHLFPEDASKITPSTRNINGKSYLYGTITGATKKKTSKTQLYDVQWEDTTLGTTPIELRILIGAVDQSKTIQQPFEPGPFSPDAIFNKDVLSYLIHHVDEGETGNPLDSDEDDGTEDTTIGNTIVFGNADVPKIEDGMFVASSQSTKGGNRKRDDGLRFKWRADTPLPPR